MESIDHHLQMLRSGRGFGRWTMDHSWLEMRHIISRCELEITLMELFGGLSTAFIGMSALGIKVKLLLYADINPDLYHWITKLHSGNVLRCGPAGDVMNLEINALPVVDVIVAGPPCPPWSAIGSKRSWNDNRSHPFWRTIDIISHQATKGTLRFFILENVGGFTHRRKDGSVPLKDVLALLNDVLPKRWTVDYHLYNTKDFGLPQNRQRLYITGRFISHSDHSQLGRPPPLDMFTSRGALADIVDGNVTSVGRFFGQCGIGYTPLQRRNLAEWKALLRHSLSNPALIGSFACFAYDRTPAARTSWRSTLNLDYSECLTAKGPVLHLLSLGDHGNAVDRALLPSERGNLQGFQRWFIDNSFMPSESCKALGNSMSVPVIASVCYRELCYMLGVDVHRLRSCSGHR